MCEVMRGRGGKECGAGRGPRPSRAPRTRRPSSSSSCRTETRSDETFRVAEYTGSMIKSRCEKVALNNRYFCKNAFTDCFTAMPSISLV